MIRIAFTEESKNDSSYQMLITSETETISDLLLKKKIDTATKNVFVNGKQIKPEQYQTPVKNYTKSQTIVFVTVKYKSFDKPRRASK